MLGVFPLGAVRLDIGRGDGIEGAGSLLGGEVLPLSALPARADETVGPMTMPSIARNHVKMPGFIGLSISKLDR